MKLYRAAMTIVLSGLVVGCGKKDFTGKALNSYLAVPGDSSQCTASSPTSKTENVSQEAPSLFETKGKKIQISENNFGDSSPFASDKVSDPVLPQGKRLVVLANEKCIQSSRESGDDSDLSAALEVNDRAPAAEKSFALTLEQDTLLSDLEYLAETDPCIKGVGENVVHYTMAAPNDPQYVQQEHFTNMKASQGWDVFYDASSGIKQDVVIAIIDSGVDQDHPDLVNNRWVNPGEIAGNGIDDDNNGKIDDVYGYNFASDIADPNPQAWPGSDAGGETHGTHVAGLAAALANNSIGVAGVNGLHSKIMALNVFGAVAGADTPNIDNAIRYAADKGAHVINMSLGGTGSSPTTDSAIRYAISKGVVVIIAAGNSNADTSGFSPAKYGKSIEGAMAIGAIDSVSSAKCGFSNFSTTYVEMAASGCKSGTQGVLSTLNNARYGRLQGTSMASPVTAGVASLAYGLIWSRTGTKPTPAVVEEVMKAGARVESALTGSFMGGKVVDLALLSTEINRRYPAGAIPQPTPVPSPAPCP